MPSASLASDPAASIARSMAEAVMGRIENQSSQKSSPNVIETSDNHSYMLRRMEAAAGDLIKKARLRRGLSQRALGDLVGLSQPAIKKIENGETLKSRFLANIARVLGIPLAKLDPSLEIIETKGDGAIIPRAELVGERNLPVYGSAEGGEGAMVVSTEAVEYVGRPAPLASVRDGYALIITGESMEPELWAGDLALVHPHLPPALGCTHVFEGMDENGDRLVLAKYLLKVTTKTWRVRQWNPRDGEPAEFDLDRRKWPKCHRVVGKYSRR